MGFVAAGSSSSSSFLFSPFNFCCPQKGLKSTFLLTSSRNGDSVRRGRGVLACLSPDNSRNGDFCTKRLIIFVGISVVRLLNLKAEAVEEVSAGAEDANENYLYYQKQEQKTEGNPFFSFENVVGILGSGLFAVLAPLYLSIKKEKAASDAALESVEDKLKEKQAAITLLEKKFESDLQLEKEIQIKALSKASEEKQTLHTQVQQLNQMITSLKEDLQKEKQVSEKRNALVKELESSLAQAHGEKLELQEQLKSKLNSIASLEDKVDKLSSEIKSKEVVLQNADSKLAAMEKELSEVISSYQKAQNQITSLQKEVQQLKDATLKFENELESKNLVLNDLNVELASARAEINVSRRSLDTLLEEFGNFKSSTETKAASDSKLLGERQKVVQQLEDNLKVALNDADKNRALIFDLTKERDDLVSSLSTELQNVKNLQQQLQITRESLDKSRAVASDLTKQLQLSETLRSQLESEILKIKDENSKTRDSLEREISEAKSEAKGLSEELKSTKEEINKSDKELDLLSKELASVLKKKDSFEKEIVYAQETAEKTTHDLQREKKPVSSLKTQLKDLLTQISKDKAAEESLKTHLKEVSKSVDEMNQNASALSRELELSNSQISSLNDEKEALQKALEQQKKVSREARENMEEAHSVIMRIGKERDNLGMREKKLEEELASAQGEILGLRSKMSLSTTQIGNHQHAEGGNNKSAVPARRVARRRKITPQKEEP